MTNRASQVESIIARGTVVPLVFHQDAVAASQTAVALPVSAGGGVTAIAIGGTAFAVVDDDNAAATGVALYVVPTGQGPFATFDSTTAGNADAVWHTATDAVAVINDNDTPGGVQVYFDEDAANADSRLLCVSPLGIDLFVLLSDGQVLRIKHDAAAAANGVAVYFDDDAADPANRMLFVSPTNAAGAGVTDDTVGLAWTATQGEVASAVTAFVAPFPFSIIAVGAALSATPSAGSLLVAPTINGTAKTNPAVTLTTTATGYDAAGRSVAEGNAGDTIGVKITTSAPWNAPTADLDVMLMVLFHLSDEV